MMPNDDEQPTMKVRDAMVSEVLSLAPDVSLPEAAQTLANAHYSGAPVVRDDEVVGIISEADILTQLMDAARTSSLVILPTPLTEHREPDLSAVLGAAESLASRLRPGHLVVLESTTYPGTTREEVAPVLERSGLRAGRDFHLAHRAGVTRPGRLPLDVITPGAAPQGLCLDRRLRHPGRRGSQHLRAAHRKAHRRRHLANRSGC